MLSDEEKKEYEELKSLLYTGTLSQYGKRKLIEIIEKQSKEIERINEILIWKQKHEEELQKEIEELKNNIHLKEVYVLKTDDYIEGIDKEELCNKKWEDKIKAKIEELKQKKYILSSRESEIEILKSLLEKE